MKNNSLFGKSIVSASQFSKEEIEHVFGLTKELIKIHRTKECKKILKCKSIAVLFYEPSTRTSSSFIAAMHSLGGDIVAITQGVQYSSVAKGETLEDTIKTLECYSDAVVLRHPEIGSAARAAKVASIPIINAGDGPGEHPTQGLLDLFTILNEVDTSKEITIAMVGDLRFGRTVHSLIKFLCIYGLKFRLTLISPDTLRTPEHILEDLKAHGIKYAETPRIESALHADIIYITRVQKERFLDLGILETAINYYRIDQKFIDQMDKYTIIMHPLPRVDEINPEIDTDPRAAYFRQVKNGMFVRMALLTSILNKDIIL